MQSAGKKFHFLFWQLILVTEIWKHKATSQGVQNDANHRQAALAEAESRKTKAMESPIASERCKTCFLGFVLSGQATSFLVLGRLGFVPSPLLVLQCQISEYRNTKTLKKFVTYHFEPKITTTNHYILVLEIKHHFHSN